jgi:hypothetical protein
LEFTGAIMETVNPGSLKHYLESLMIYGSVYSYWDNKTQSIEYVIPSTCLNGFDGITKFSLSKEEIHKLYSEHKND